MCGRYTLIRLADFTDMFPWIRGPELSPPPRYNVAPSQAVAVVPNDGKNRIDFFQWGLLPSWAKDTAISNSLINARAETLAEKPAFRSALKRRRCVVPASGFYEWKRSADGKSKTPMYIHRADGKPLALAGLWETWHSPDGSEVRSCAIITVPPNELMAEIHNRMPAILPESSVEQWLAGREGASESLAPLLAPFPAELMRAYSVSRLVNNPRNDTAACIEPAESLPPPDRSRKPRPRHDQGGTLFDSH